MVKNKCNTCDGCKEVPVVCHQGLPEDDCPKRRLENEKLMYGALLLIAVAMLVWTHCC